MSIFDHDYPDGDEHEFSAPSEYDDSTVSVSKVGGGTVGRSYGGAWHYCRRVGGEVTHRGSDLVTGSPRTHNEAADDIAAFLSDD
jgi:hypothetical protein